MQDHKLTQHRRLRNAFPLWASTPRISVATRTSVNAPHYNAVIVGAGISGALMAHALADGRRRILIVASRSKAAAWPARP